ncbi:hypothetical protein L917_10730 [Phytophthora nicotianae]|uniref:Uncharacterized protein n=1 Tax=Phytophthora nicotianae TaxID=4792 RepID=W2IVC5_PHYNI|nr:hypothetical protein L916_10826 [Phytophthora nicotianae]ETL90630.1 hypothetical protein L917_10730 [Phytophthora nicotianae]
MGTIKHMMGLQFCYRTAKPRHWPTFNRGNEHLY